MLTEREWMFEQRQLWELEGHNAFNENRIPVRFIGRQFNLINNNIMGKTSFGNNLVSVSPKKKEKEVQRLSQKLNNQNIRSLAVTSGNKRIEYRYLFG
jgi:hypothetical protein